MYNASVSCSSHVLGSDKRRCQSSEQGCSLIPFKNDPTMSLYQSQTSGHSLNEGELDDLEVASFKTACDDSPVADDLDDFPLNVQKPVVDRKPRHRTVDIATLKEVAKTIEIDTILDGYEDILDEGAPSKMPTNKLTCYFERKLTKNVRASPAISVSTADTISSPMRLPEQRSRSLKPEHLSLQQLDNDDAKTSASSAVSYVSISDAASKTDVSPDEEVPEIAEGAEIVERRADTVERTSDKQQETVVKKCACGHPAHYLKHDPEFPILSNKSVEPFSVEEAIILASAEYGHWVTMVERSQSLDQQYKLMGLSYMKRSIMNRLAVPLTFFPEKNKTVIHIHVHTPIGIRHMHNDLTGKPAIDDDPDCGFWEGVTSVIDYSVPWYCGGNPVRALRQRRTNPKVGLCLETRCVLPDAKEGKIMLFNFVLYPAKDPNNPISTDRILKCVRKD